MALDKIDIADPAWPERLNDALQKIWGGGTKFPLSHDWTSDGVTWQSGFQAWDSENYSKAQIRVTEWATFYDIEYRGAVKLTKNMAATPSGQGTSMLVIPQVGNTKDDLWYYGQTSTSKATVALHQGSINLIANQDLTSDNYINFCGMVRRLK